jgi:recombinational DNA repair ATPase RecF
MNIAEWERKIKSAKFHLSNAKNDFQRQVAQHDFRLLEADFTKAWLAWVDERTAETKRLMEARNDQTTQINAAIISLHNELREAKQNNIISSSASPTKPE